MITNPSLKVSNFLVHFNSGRPKFWCNSSTDKIIISGSLVDGATVEHKTSVTARSKIKSGYIDISILPRDLTYQDVMDFAGACRGKNKQPFTQKLIELGAAIHNLNMIITKNTSVDFIQKIQDEAANGLAFKTQQNIPKNLTDKHAIVFSGVIDEIAF